MFSTENLHFASSLGNWKQAFIALAPSKVVKSPLLSLSQNALSGSILNWNWNGLFLLPNTYIIIYTYCFSYYFFSVYVSLSKNSLSLPSAPNFSAKADAKVRTIFHPCKYFKNFFREKRKVFAFFDNTENLHLIILYIERQKREPTLLSVPIIYGCKS